MTFNDLKENYLSTPFTEKANKNFMKINALDFNSKGVSLFNSIIELCENTGFQKCSVLPSGALSHARDLKYISRYVVNYSTRMNSVELIIASREFGCFRFILGHIEVKEPAKGKNCLLEFYRICKMFNVDLAKYALTKEEGLKVKATIEKPHIYAYELGFFLGNVHHLDLNSSYFARIAEAFPDFYAPAKFIYDMRKTNEQASKFYKDILNCTQGIMQSKYCVDYTADKRSHISPYQFSNLSKAGINGTRRVIEKYINILKREGKKILLTNTDGIWYQGTMYHDENEGSDFGQWKHDHTNCDILIKSAGAYQYREGGVVHSVVRGETALDLMKERKYWKFGEILYSTGEGIMYYFNSETYRVERR